MIYMTSNEEFYWLKIPKKYIMNETEQNLFIYLPHSTKKSGRFFRTAKKHAKSVGKDIWISVGLDYAYDIENVSKQNWYETRVTMNGRLLLWQYQKEGECVEPK